MEAVLGGARACAPSDSGSPRPPAPRPPAPPALHPPCPPQNDVIRLCVKAGVPPHVLRNGEAIVPNLRELARHCERQIRRDGTSDTAARDAANDSGDSLTHPAGLPLPDLPLPKELFATAVQPPAAGNILLPASPRVGKAVSLDEWEMVDGAAGWGR